MLIDRVKKSTRKLLVFENNVQSVKALHPIPGPRVELYYGIQNFPFIEFQLRYPMAELGLKSVDHLLHLFIKTATPEPLQLLTQLDDRESHRLSSGLNLEHRVFCDAALALQAASKAAIHLHWEGSSNL